MKLGILLRKVGIRCELSNRQANLEIRGITDDSRRVKKDYLFVAVKGLEHDGHKYIEQAIRHGAKIVLFDVKSKVKIQKSKVSEVAFVGVENSREVLGLLWAAWYGFPSRKLKVIGVTGTDGKTTTANLIYHLLKVSGKKVGLVSTINAQIGDRKVNTGFHVTSPHPELLQKLLSEMVMGGLRYAVLEVTSHGLDQERLAGVKFHIAVVTNITHEHLDYHKNYRNYLTAKAKLFQNVAFSVLNRDDRSYGYLSTVAAGRIVTYGFGRKADLCAGKVALTGERSRFVFYQGKQETPVRLPLPGRYNVANALAAGSACLVLGLPMGVLAEHLGSFRGLMGRFEEIREGQPFRVIVDFAHTPNALRQVLELSQKAKGKSRRLIVVFGCAGERDRGKRPMMGRVAGRLANITILTAEDPRREDVNKIIEQIAVGCRKVEATEISDTCPPARQVKYQISKIQTKDKKEKHRFFKEPDRRKAIELAVRIAQPSDLVIITGKGHERSMCYGTTEYPWNDQQVARQELKRLLRTRN